MKYYNLLIFAGLLSICSCGDRGTFEIKKDHNDNLILIDNISGDERPPQDGANIGLAMTDIEVKNNEVFIMIKNGFRDDAYFPKKAHFDIFDENAGFIGNGSIQGISDQDIHDYYVVKPGTSIKYPIIISSYFKGIKEIVKIHKISIQGYYKDIKWKPNGPSGLVSDGYLYEAVELRYSDKYVIPNITYTK